MVITIARWVVRVCGTIALILGIIFWTGNADGLVGIHMLLGILVVLSLWVLGITFGLAKGGNWGLASLAIVWGILVLALGLSQESLMNNSAHWVIQVLHLLVGLAAIGIGEAVGGRYTRLNSPRVQTM